MLLKACPRHSALYAFSTAHLPLALPLLQPNTKMSALAARTSLRTAAGARAAAPLPRAALPARVSIRARATENEVGCAAAAPACSLALDLGLSLIL